MTFPKINDSQFDTLDDLCRCPGLYAGQYKDIEALPRGLVRYAYSNGAERLLGIPHAYPTDEAFDVLEAARS